MKPSTTPMASPSPASRSVVTVCDQMSGKSLTSAETTAMGLGSMNAGMRPSEQAACHTASTAATAMAGTVFCLEGRRIQSPYAGITQIRFLGRGIGFHLSAGPNPQLPVCVPYSRAS